jgi:plastocyanin domain-containing protein
MKGLRMAVATAAVAVLVAGGITVAYALTDPPVQRIEIEVSARGFVPASFELRPGVPAELVFTRTTPSRCAAEVHIPDMGVARVPLVQGEPVTIRVAAPKAGGYTFMCGMNMFRGTVVVRN